MDELPEIEGVRVTVHRGPDLPPDVLEYPAHVRVVARAVGDLMIIHRWQKVAKRYHRGEWTGYGYELIYKQPRKLPF